MFSNFPIFLFFLNRPFCFEIRAILELLSPVGFSHDCLWAHGFCFGDVSQFQIGRSVLCFPIVLLHLSVFSSFSPDCLDVSIPSTADRSLLSKDLFCVKELSISAGDSSCFQVRSSLEIHVIWWCPLVLLLSLVKP